MRISLRNWISLHMRQPSTEHQGKGEEQIVVKSPEDSKIEQIPGCGSASGGRSEGVHDSCGSQILLDVFRCCGRYNS
jgi:hypothetical protein